MSSRNVVSSGAHEDEARSFILQSLQGAQPSAEKEQKTLEQCLQIIDDACGRAIRDEQAGASGSLPDTSWWWRSHRLLVLQRYDCLQTLMALNSGYVLKHPDTSIESCFKPSFLLVSQLLHTASHQLNSALLLCIYFPYYMQLLCLGRIHSAVCFRPVHSRN